MTTLEYLTPREAEVVLHKSCLHSNLSVLTALLSQYEFSPDCLGEALNTAVRHSKSIELVRLLLLRGAPLGDTEYRMPMLVANSSLEILQLLIEHGWDVKTSGGATLIA